ncbi:MAG: hypothetical protein LV477_00880 [Candidatus Nitrosotalea sp.]|nr:hypothetical protein [Candidatus Nitrosotalea sp.]
MNPIIKGGLFGMLAITVYLLVVIVTTPALLPQNAIKAVFILNSPIIIGTGMGVGLQIYLAEYGKKMGCNLKIKRTLGGNSGGTVVTSFFSFFSLIPLGCCGWWLYAISFLPSIFGSGFSAVLINYSQPLAYLGLVVIFSFNGLTILKIMNEKKKHNLQYK